MENSTPLFMINVYSHAGYIFVSRVPIHEYAPNGVCGTCSNLGTLKNIERICVVLIQSCGLIVSKYYFNGF